jgi:nucleoside-diphosphate-sugar epimerase
VTVAHRGSRDAPADLIDRGVAVASLDRDAPGALARALGEGADAVIDVTAYGPEHARQLLEVQGAIGSFVVVSSSSVYRDEDGRTLDEAATGGFPRLPVPIQETQPTVAPGPATYSTRKVALERALLDEATTPVTILRPAAIHGPGSIHPREWWFVKRMLDKRPVIPIAYLGESRFHTTAAANIAALTRVALERPGSRVLNIADPEATPVAGIGSLIARHMKYAGRIVGLDGGPTARNIGRTPWSVPRPFVLDTSAALALGYAPVTTYEQAVGAICEDLSDADIGEGWRARFPVLASYPYDQFDYASEDALLTLV